VVRWWRAACLCLDGWWCHSQPRGDNCPGGDGMTRARKHPHSLATCCQVPPTRYPQQGVRCPQQGVRTRASPRQPCTACATQQPCPSSVPCLLQASAAAAAGSQGLESRAHARPHLLGTALPRHARSMLDRRGPHLCTREGTCDRIAHALNVDAAGGSGLIIIPVARLMTATLLGTSENYSLVEPQTNQSPTGLC